MTDTCKIQMKYGELHGVTKGPENTREMGAVLNGKLASAVQCCLDSFTPKQIIC